MRLVLLAHEASFTSQLVLEIACFLLPRLELQVGCDAQAIFTWVLEIRILVLKLV